MGCEHVVAFRCDASPEIGAGHVMRCLTLAHALRQQGQQVLFWTNVYGQELLKRFAEFDYLECITEGSDFVTMTLPTEIILRAHYLVVDRYGINRQTLEAWSEKVPVMRIDDLYEDVSACDAVLNQNAYADSACYGPKGPLSRLMGPSYALLRPTFRELRERVRYTSQARRLLLTFGGADAVDASETILNYLTAWRIRPLEITLVLGTNYPYDSGRFLKAPYAGYHRIQVQRSVTKMAELMQNMTPR